MADLLLADPAQLVVLPPEPVQVIACPRLFTAQDRRILRIPQGLRLHEILLEAGIVPDAHARVWIDDWLIPREMWARVRPRAGRIVTVRVIPAGGGQGGKTIGRILIVLAATLIGAAVGFGVGGVLGFAAGSFALTASVAIGSVVGGIAGQFLANALIPIQQPKLDALASDNPGASPSFSLQASRNQMRPYGKVPRVYGRVRMTPPYAAAPLTTIEGADQYLTAIFCLGYGPLEVRDPRIGFEPLDSFQGVTTEIRNPWNNDGPLTLYQNDVYEEPLVLPVQSPGGLVRQIPVGVHFVSVDLTWPRGAFHFNPNTGEFTGAPVTTDLWVREQGTAAWVGAYSETVGFEPIREVIRKTYRTFQLDPAKSYEVMVSRNQFYEDANTADDIIWTAIRWERPQAPVHLAGVTLYVLKIKASEQLNGVIDTFNVEVEATLPRPEGFSWVTEATQNPAAAFRAVLQGSATRTPVPDARINLDALAEWGEWCWTKGYTYDAVIDYDVTVGQLLADIAACGLATPTFDAQGRYSVLRDVEQAVPVQLFTPRNSWGFSGSKALPDRPHAFKVRYLDGLGTQNTAFPQPSEEPSWEIDEQYVYAPGYSAANASRFETLEFRGVSALHHASSLAKYHMAVAELRPEVWTLNADVENLVCLRGDRVQIMHDVLLGGLGAGRIKSVTLNGGGAMTGLVLDEEVLTEIGKSYVIRVRHSTTGTQVTASIVSTGTATQTVTFGAAQSSDFAAPGDLFAYGEVFQETLAALVKAIEPGPDLTARLTLVPYNDAIYDWDAGPPPPFNPQISRGGVRPPWQRPGPPAPPHIEAVQADETTILFGPDGVPTLRILAFVNYIAQPGAPDQAPEFVLLEGQIVESFTDNPWRSIPLVPGSAGSLAFTGVGALGLYDIRVRTVAGQQVSPWSRWNGIFVTGRTTRPPDVPVFMVESGNLRWSYPNAQVDHAGFRLRRQFGDNAVWENAQPLHDGLLPPAQAFWPLTFYSTPTTYLIKAVNSSGLESVHATYAGVDLGDRDVENIIRSVDYQAAGFPGTIVNGTIVGGDEIHANSVDLFWSGGDAAPFWRGDAETFWVGQYHQMSYLFSLLPDTDEVPCTIQLFIAVGGQAISIEYRTAGAGPFWTSDGSTFWSTDGAAFWTPSGGDGGFLPWPGIITGATHQVYEFRVTTAGGPVQGTIAYCAAIVDVPDIFEYFEDVVIASPGGTRLPITKQYRAIVVVHHSLENDGGSAVRISTEDKGIGTPFLTDGPLLKAWNNGSVATTALCDALVKGY